MLVNPAAKLLELRPARASMAMTGREIGERSKFGCYKINAAVSNLRWGLFYEQTDVSNLCRADGYRG